MTPDVFSGLWRRRSVAIGDGEPHEPASVHWIQWGDRFLDVRQPVDDGAPLLSGPGVFGGTTTWREPALTWRHELDSQPGAAADEGVVSWDRELLVERGSADIDGEAVPYEEVWERVTVPMPAAGRAWSPWRGALAVEVDGHRMAAVVDPDGSWFGALSRREPDGRWDLGPCVGERALLRVLHDVLLGAG